ncbi:MAG TPA: right-handed parallel beta-helix repeat-containing protein [Planctomycetota bacterium]|nr:right-handed parallel beta-helix repeat-containing protein [Planctomycetota bacterium]
MKYWGIVLCIILTSCITTNQKFDTIRVTLQEISSENKTISMSDTTVPQDIPNTSIVSVIQQSTLTPTSTPTMTPTPTSTPTSISTPTMTPTPEVSSLPTPLDSNPAISTIPSTIEKPIVKATPQASTEVIVKAQLIDKLPEEIDSPMELKAGNYIVDYNINITEKGSLTIQPNTKIEFNTAGIFCKGKIIAQGTKTSPIKFYSSYAWDNITVTGEDAYGEFQYCSLSEGLGIEVSITFNGKCNFKTTNTIIGGGLLLANQAKGIVKHCQFENNDNLGALALVGVQDVIISDTHFNKNLEYAIYIVESTGNIEQIEIQEHSKIGISCRKNTEMTICKSTWQRNNIAIEILDNSKIDLLDNYFHNNEVGCEFFNKSQGNVKNNQFTEHKKICIAIYDTSTPNIHTNTFKNNQDIILIQNYSNPIITNNTIDNCRYAFIIMNEKIAESLKNNEIQNCQYQYKIIKK